MKLLLITPQKNEGKYIKSFLNSIVEQTRRPDLLLIVDDGSKDESIDIVNSFIHRHEWIKMVHKPSSEIRATGGKIVEAFTFGLKQITLDDFDLIGKIDADLILPTDYFAAVEKAFIDNDKLGISGGICVIEKKGKLVPENLNKSDHVRGALKTYRKDCYLEINGLKPTLGWDTLDEHLARYHGWEVAVNQDLNVIHLRPTNKTSNWKQLNFRHGQMFYEQRYGLVWGIISSLKRALKHKPYFFSGVLSLLGFIDSAFRRRPFIITREEGAYLRKYRTRSLL